MVWEIKMDRYRCRSFTADVGSMIIQSISKCAPRFSYILLKAEGTSDQVNEVGGTTITVFNDGKILL